MNHSLSQQGQTYSFDVLIIGSGLAGIHYGLQVLTLQPTLRIALISKDVLTECNSRYAQGGIAAVSKPEDSLDAHIHDTLQAGDGLSYPPSVEAIIRQGPEAIAQLRQYHINFHQTAQGEDSLAQEGGHSQRRIYHCQDQTGLSIMQALQTTLEKHPQIQILTHHIALNLITHYDPHQTQTQGEVLGAYILDTQTHLIHTFLARSVILATGGAGKTYRYTSNPMIATGDGVAMAYRAGARVGNMEFYQFHPTLLHHHTLNNFLISEAVRGEGAILKNADTLQPFMQRYAPEQRDLATRDIVARAIFNEMDRHEKNFVYLDSTKHSRAFLKKRFPHIFQTLLSIGMDMSQDLIPVVPAAHYQCGGVLTDLNGRTDLNRLYAIGEVAFTGLHGANRLASNSLLEAVVMASRAAHHSLKAINTPFTHTHHIELWNSTANINPRRASQINAHWRSLRGEMTSYAGIIRTEDGLCDLLNLIKQRHKIIDDYYWTHYITRDLIELRNIVLNAELIVRAALARRESRGGHYREDFPNKNKCGQESIARIHHDPFQNTQG